MDMKRFMAVSLLALLLLMGGCMRRGGGKDDPALPQPEATPRAADSAKQGQAARNLIPQRLERDAQGVPVLKVYDTENEALEELSVEDYLPAVLAGEMAGDWPLEALKAQAILPA